MKHDTATQPHALSDLSAAVIWATANLLLMMYVGEWLVYTGGVCLATSLLILVAALTGRDRLRQASANFLLALTLANFNGWAFSHLANLPFFLGLFFFLLFGLLLGATLFRFLSSFRPVAKSLLVSCGVVFILWPWYGGLVLEASYLPGDAFKGCIRPDALRRLPEGVTKADLELEIPLQARDFLAKNYGSNLTLGYVRWALKDGAMPLSLDGQSKPLIYERLQRRLGMGIRLVVSLFLLGYGITSQIKWLDKTAEDERAIKIARAKDIQADPGTGATCA